MVVKVETFEQDIAEEIKRKDASLTEISAASNNIGNNPEDTMQKPKPVFLIVLVSMFICAMIGLLGLAYFYFTDSLLPPSQASVEVTPEQIPKATSTLSRLSYTLDVQVGRFVTLVEKKDTGYVVTINSYAPVFSYMTRNEADYIQELANVISPPLETSTKATPQTPVVPPPVTQASTSTSASSSTPKTSTSTEATSTVATSTPEEEQVGPYFKDVTIANQNMRVWVNGNQMLVYAFITTEKIAISATIEGILALKGAIIR